MGREREREGEKHQCVVAFRMPTTGDLVHNPGMCPDWELNWPPFGSQAGLQSTERHQLGQGSVFLMWMSNFLFQTLKIWRKKHFSVKLLLLACSAYFL